MSGDFREGNDQDYVRESETTQPVFPLLYDLSKGERTAATNKLDLWKGLVV